MGGRGGRRAGESGEGVGHEAFAAGFVDGGFLPSADFDVKALTGCGDGAGESGWSCSSYEDCCLSEEDP